MVRTELQDASQTLRETIDLVEDDAIRSRLDSHADQLEELANRDHGPDHGRLDRHQYALQTLKTEVDDAVADQIDDALGLISGYRETVEGI